MYRCGCGVGCLSGSIDLLSEHLSGSICRVGVSLTGSVIRTGVELPTQGLSGRVSLVCTTNKERPYWLWDAGEILRWDNNNTIDIWE